MNFYGDLLLTDPAYIANSDADWKSLLSEGYDHAALHLLGIGISLSAEAGSDTQRTVLDENGRKIGTFCTDSALFCVCDLAQVLVYHPDFLMKNEKYPGTFCIVRDFDGEVSLLNDENGNLQFIGTGENGFRTVCSGGKYEN
jgi:hypothetical protein